MVVEESICPKCKLKLRAHMVDGIPVEYCPDCGGLWIQQEDLKRAVEKPPSQEPSMEEKSQVAVWEEPRFPCPRCARPMAKANYAYSSGVIVDRCELCKAVWLDRGELLKLRAFVHKEIPQEQILMAKLQAEAIRKRYQAKEIAREARSPLRKISLGSLLGSIRDIILKD